MIGRITPASSGERPNHSPARIPNVAPITSPTTTSVTVVATWIYRSPRAQLSSRAPIRLGRLIQVEPVAAPAISHTASHATPTPICHARMARPPSSVPPPVVRYGSVPDKLLAKNVLRGP